MAVLEAMGTSLFVEAAFVEDSILPVEIDVETKAVDDNDDDNIEEELEEDRFCKLDTVTPKMAKKNRMKCIVESRFAKSNAKCKRVQVDNKIYRKSRRETNVTRSNVRLTSKILCSLCLGSTLALGM